MKKHFKYLGFNDMGKTTTSIKEQCSIGVVVVPKGTVCGYCNDTGWDSYPNHDTTPRPCPECQP